MADRHPHHCVHFGVRLPFPCVIGGLGTRLPALQAPEGEAGAPAGLRVRCICRPVKTSQVCTMIHDARRAASADRQKRHKSAQWYLTCEAVRDPPSSQKRDTATQYIGRWTVCDLYRALTTLTKWRGRKDVLKVLAQSVGRHLNLLPWRPAQCPWWGGCQP